MYRSQRERTGNQFAKFLETKDRRRELPDPKLYQNHEYLFKKKFQLSPTYNLKKNKNN